MRLGLISKTICYEFCPWNMKYGLISRTIRFQFALKCEIRFDFQDNLFRIFPWNMKLALISRTICFQFALKCEIRFNFQDNFFRIVRLTWQRGINSREHSRGRAENVCTHLRHNSFATPAAAVAQKTTASYGSCLKKGQHSIVLIIHLFLPIKYIFFYSVSKILFQIFCLCYWISLPIMILKMKTFLHTVYKIFNK